MLAERLREAATMPAFYLARCALKIRELPIYKGKSIKEYQNFFYQAKLKQCKDRDIIQVIDANKITHYMSSFEGIVRDVQKCKERIMGVNSSSQEDFSDFIKNAIADLGNCRTQLVKVYENTK